MSDKLLEKYTGRRTGDSMVSLHAAADVTDSEHTDDMGCFGWLRGVRDRALMLELRKKDGSILAIAYAYIERMEFDPSSGIGIHAGGRTIRIKGRNLNADARPGVRLFEGMTRQRVTWIAEGPRTLLASSECCIALVEEISA